MMFWTSTCISTARARHRHQAPARLIVPHDGQQATMKNADLLAKRPPDNEQRFD
jgi:hypothetical protein